MKNVLLTVREEGAVDQRARDQIVDAVFPRLERQVLNNEFEKFVWELWRHSDCDGSG